MQFEQELNNILSKDYIDINDIANKLIENKQYNILKFIFLMFKDQFEEGSDCCNIKHLVLENKFDEVNLYFENKKNGSNKKRVLILCNWCSSKDLCNLWDKMSKGNCEWDNIKLVWEEPADYYCVINKPINEDIKLDLSKTVYFRMEPFVERHKQMWGDTWSNPTVSDFKFCGTYDLHFSNTEWHISKTYNQLMNEKVIKDVTISNILSTVLSNKYTDPGHQKRIDFVKFLEKKGLPVHVYGSNGFLWKDYKGSLPYHAKDNALFPYKYTFNCENFSQKNFCTEKLYDGILAECLVFYNGCINIKDRIDERAFVYLHLSNFEKDYETIKKAIEDNWWQHRLPYIRQAKKKILNELQFFPRLERIIN